MYEKWLEFFKDEFEKVRNEEKSKGEELLKKAEEERGNDRGANLKFGHQQNSFSQWGKAGQ